MDDVKLRAAQGQTQVMGVSLQGSVFDGRLRSAIGLQIAWLDAPGELVPDHAGFLLLGRQLVSQIWFVVVDFFEFLDEEKLPGVSLVTVGQKLSCLHVLPLQGSAAADHVGPSVVCKPDFSLSCDGTVDDVFSLLLGRLGNNRHLALSQPGEWRSSFGPAADRFGDNRWNGLRFC